MPIRITQLARLSGRAVALALAVVLLAAAPPALADDRDGERRYRQWDRGHDHGRHADRDRDRGRHADRRHDRGRHADRRHDRGRHFKQKHRPRHWDHRRRHGRHFRPDRHRGGHRWYGFTPIALALVDTLSELQYRAYYDAHLRATTAAVGDTILWNQGGAAGAVTVVKDGRDAVGRYCREFQQRVIIGGRNEDAYGTACLQPDGDWELAANGY